MARGGPGVCAVGQREAGVCAGQIRYDVETAAHAVGGFSFRAGDGGFWQGGGAGMLGRRAPPATYEVTGDMYPGAPPA